MKFGKIIGRVVSTQKVESFEGLKLVLVQPLNEKLEVAGDALVAVDTLQADIGQIVYYETSKEASRIIEKEMNPCDAAVMGIVDDIQLIFRP
ncbi:MAG: ethanolamine utilization protein EutN [Bacteroidetes bacterium CG18_big_fil_WC_8_21_14_2_50_41_14]|nr:MAG: ethanolamine utilization protein EutN [Bacteroidetes bacterium CG18_big_fil_WC_8_21_14_2_50_41_14]PJB57776.1 MAG: ethanolamine utilization protein EutN [Bacteroidetes bacterium CG_4_9_14_3_um_filter_41_19]